jgi:putative hydrolase of the HAD superfamily
MPIRAVVFDLGDTLWFEARDLDPAQFVRMQAARLEPLVESWRLPAPISLDQLQAEVWMTCERWWHGEGRRDHREVDLPAVIREVAERHAIALSPEQARDWWRAAWVPVPEMGNQLYPDVLDVLRDLRAMGIRVGINSNRPCTGDMTLPDLVGFGMDEYVDAVVCSGDTGYMKPHRSTFDLVLDRLGTPAAETMMVGDSCAADIVGAKSAGMIGVLKLNGRYDVAVCGLPDYVIHDLGELLALPPFESPEHAAAYAVESLTPHDDENEHRY